MLPKAEKRCCPAFCMERFSLCYCLLVQPNNVRCSLLWGEHPAEPAREDGAAVVYSCIANDVRQHSSISRSKQDTRTIYLIWQASYCLVGSTGPCAPTDVNWYRVAAVIYAAKASSKHGYRASTTAWWDRHSTQQTGKRIQLGCSASAKWFAPLTSRP